MLCNAIDRSRAVRRVRPCVTMNQIHYCVAIIPHYQILCRIFITGFIKLRKIDFTSNTYNLVILYNATDRSRTVRRVRPCVTMNQIHYCVAIIPHYQILCRIFIAGFIKLRKIDLLQIHIIWSYYITQQIGHGLSQENDRVWQWTETRFCSYNTTVTRSYLELSSRVL
jgi:hypothetical protein